MNLDFYKSHKYGEENKNKIVIGPFYGDFKNHSTFMVIGIGSLLFPDTANIQAEIHYTRSLNKLYELGKNNGNIKTGGFEFIFSKRF